MDCTTSASRTDAAILAGRSLLGQQQQQQLHASARHRQARRRARGSRPARGRNPDVHGCAYLLKCRSASNSTAASGLAATHWRASRSSASASSRTCRAWRATRCADARTCAQGSIGRPRSAGERRAAADSRRLCALARPAVRPFVQSAAVRPPPASGAAHRQQRQGLGAPRSRPSAHMWSHASAAAADGCRSYTCARPIRPSDEDQAQLRARPTPTVCCGIINDSRSRTRRGSDIGAGVRVGVGRTALLDPLSGDKRIDRGLQDRGFTRGGKIDGPNTTMHLDSISALDLPKSTARNDQRQRIRRPAMAAPGAGPPAGAGPHAAVPDGHESALSGRAPGAIRFGAARGEAGEGVSQRKRGPPPPVPGKDPDGEWAWVFAFP
eukprot:scaffold5084_cov385-Prasinococcus_capsulatus_cf.AAC.1